MTLAQLESLVRGGESQTAEFKQTTGQLKQAARTLCAMLNHHGGRVLFGVSPEGHLIGQDVSGRTLEDIAHEIKEIDPPVFPTIERIEVAPDRNVLVVSVTQGNVPPYTYKGKGYLRVGNTTVVMSQDEYSRILLEKLHSEKRWENTPAEGWSIGDLDETEIVRTINEAVRRGRVADPDTRDITELLRGMGLIRGGDILRAAVVLFGRPTRVEAELPQCLLRIARFRGTDRTEFIDNKQFHGNVFSLLSTAERFLRDVLPVAGRVQSGLFERVDDPLYPPTALREALANAFCHRDYTIGGGSVAVAVYDDRLEVSSSGTLHFGLTAEALYHPHESMPWNPLIARVLYRRGIVESWGRGTLKIAELSELAGLPRPDIEEAGGSVVVRFKPSSYIAPGRVARELTEQQRAILQVIATSKNGIPLRTMRNALGRELAEWQLKENLSILKQLELIRTEGHARGARWHLNR